jgi:hypothetical protein
MNLGCRFSFWLLVDSRYINSILPKQEQSYWGNGGCDTRWYAHAYATHVASCVARSSRRIRELDNFSLHDLVKRQCTSRLSTRRTTETITLPRTDEQPTQSRRIDVKTQTGWTAVQRSTTPSGIERTSLQASRDSRRNKNSKSWYFWKLQSWVVVHVLHYRDI